MLNGPQKLKIKNTALRILHVPGNKPAGNILEMALVLDWNIDRNELSELAKDILSYLRKSGDPFLNIRLNLIRWKSDAIIEKCLSSFPEIAMGRIAGEKEYIPAEGEEKHLDSLTDELKKFYARSKLILFITKKEYGVKDATATEENLKPFLSKKMLSVYPDGSVVYPFKLPEVEN